MKNVHKNVKNNHKHFDYNYYNKKNSLRRILAGVK